MRALCSTIEFVHFPKLSAPFLLSGSLTWLAGRLELDAELRPSLPRPNLQKLGTLPSVSSGSCSAHTTRTGSTGIVHLQACIFHKATSSMGQLDGVSFPSSLNLCTSKPLTGNSIQETLSKWMNKLLILVSWCSVIVAFRYHHKCVAGSSGRDKYASFSPNQYTEPQDA